MRHIKFAWLVSFVAMMGSLYFSEIKGFIPCEYCWYQRILMYPLAIILMIAILRNDKKIRYYILPLSIIGMLLGGFHYLKQKLVILQHIGTCNSEVPCSAMYTNYFGFITIPLMSFTAFTLITVTLILLNKKEKRA